MSDATFQNGCPDCGDTTMFFEGFCPECGYDAEEDLDESDFDDIETVLASDACPDCGSKTEWEARFGYCFACDYDALDDDTITDILDSVEESTGPISWPGISKWAKWNGKPAEPYKPFGDLVARMKKWPFFRLYDTDHWLNRLYSKMTKKLHGMDVTHTPKAIGPVVFMPKWHMDTQSGYRILAHEACHARDFWKFGVLPFFLMQYILPFGPSGVALLEYRAYVETMKTEYEIYGKVFDKDPETYARMLASRPYKYCWPWPKMMTKWFRKAQSKIGI